MYIGANDTPASSASSRSASLKRLADPALAAAKGRMVVGSKRPRTNRACEQCRKQKSRCEPSTSNTRACHRCHKLTIPCSFLSLPEQLDSTIPSQESSPASPIIHFTHSSQSRDALTNILLQEHMFKRISGEITDEEMDKVDFNRDWADIPGVLNSVLLSFEGREECFESSQQKAPEITDDRRAQWDEIYQRYYGILHLHPNVSKDRPSTPFLQSVRHLLASQHCPNTTPEETVLLTSTVNQGAFHAISTNSKTLEEAELLDIIRAFIILSEWMPANPTLPPTGLSDGSMFRETALKLCNDIGLDRLELTPGLSEKEEDEVREKILLWFSFCTVEAMQSIIRGRSCGSERLSRLEKILPSLSLPRILFLTYRHRARYLQTMLDAFTKFSAPVERTPEWISVITDVATDALANLSTHATYLNRVIAVASPQEKKVLGASDLHQSGCLLLLLVKVTGCFRVLSVSIPDIPHRSHEDLVLTKLLREKFVFFGKHLINASEKVLILAFESPLLPSLPDSLLHLIAFSVLSSTKTNFVLYKQFVDAALLDTVSCMEEIMEGLCEKFASVGFNRPERLHTRFARLFHGLLTVWRDRASIVQRAPETNAANLSSQPSPSDSRFLTSTPSSQTLEPYFDLSIAFPGMVDYAGALQGGEAIDWVQSILSIGATSGPLSTTPMSFDYGPLNGPPFS